LSFDVCDYVKFNFLITSHKGSLRVKWVWMCIDVQCFLHFHITKHSLWNYIYIFFQPKKTNSHTHSHIWWGNKAFKLFERTSCIVDVWRVEIREGDWNTFAGSIEIFTSLPASLLLALSPLIFVLCICASTTHRSRNNNNAEKKV
jgi:hypothetical protein